ncbi:MAG: glutamate 5-kinase [Sporolactobacillus sp.]
MESKRIIVKIGSSSLSDMRGGLDTAKLNEHVAAIAKLKHAGHDVILVTSGAIAAGYSSLGYPARPVSIAGKQAAAAVGQVLLLSNYATAFRRHGLTVAQLLLARQDFERREQASHAFSTLNELLYRSVIPIINENDSISLEELTFGDNDMLSVLVGGLVHAELLIILTDVNGIYDKNPRFYADAKRYKELSMLPARLLSDNEGGKGSAVGTGGMRSKLRAAQMGLSLGLRIFIGSGVGNDKLMNIVAGDGDGTYLGTAKLRPSLKVGKQWIAMLSPVCGKIEIDRGAAQALLRDGKSLLPAGVRQVSGHFSSGEVIQIIDENHRVIGKGQVNYSAAELQQIKHLSSEEAIQRIPGGRPEVVHRNNWVPWTSLVNINREQGEMLHESGH